MEILRVNVHGYEVSASERLREKTIELGKELDALRASGGTKVQILALKLKLRLTEMRRFITSETEAPPRKIID